MQNKDRCCLRINSSTEPAHVNTDASVSGYRLDSYNSTKDFEQFPLFILIFQDRTHPGEKDNKLYARCFSRTECGVISVFCSGCIRCCKPGVCARFLVCAKQFMKKIQFFKKNFYKCGKFSSLVLF